MQVKQYIPLYIIIIILVGIFVFGYVEVNAVESQLLEPAIYMKEKIVRGEDVSGDYENLNISLEKHIFKLDMFVNHTVSDNLVQCMAEIGYDIKYNSTSGLEADTDRLIFYLKNIIDNEKGKINNIF